MPNLVGKIYRVGALALLLAGWIGSAHAQTAVQIRDNGDSANRVDLVIVAEGYTAAQQADFAVDAENITTEFFNNEPFTEYQDFMNVHRVDVVSNETGADHPERNPPTTADTAFDATFNCQDTERLLCVSTSKVNTAVNSVLAGNEREIVLVLVNDTKYGGAGGAIATTSLDSAAPEIAIHEIGHSFGLLADEYTTGPPPPCNNTTEPSEVNVTLQTARNSIKWNQGGGPLTGWIELSTNLPTTTTTAATPGAYEGARYCTDDVYRPTNNSKMRSLGKPFEQINEEQLVKRIYNWVSPLDSRAPVGNNQSIHQGGDLTFSVSGPQPQTHDIAVDWKIDGAPSGTGASFTPNTDSYAPGTILAVTADLQDETTKVRYDPGNVMSDSTAWNLEILPNDPPSCDAGGPYIAECGLNTGLNGTASSDPNGDPLTYAWSGPFTGSPVGGATPSVVFPSPTGAKSVDLEVSDSLLNDSCAAPVTVQDTLAPTVTAPGDVTAECESPAGTAVDIGTATATDACDISPTIGNNAPALFALGVTTVTWTGTDDDGNVGLGMQDVTIEDTTPPELSVDLSRTELWPPNHKYKKVTATVESTDICDADPVISLISVTSNEPDNGTDDGDTVDDIVIVDDVTLELRAERSGIGTGRIYTVTYQAIDGSGNTTVQEVTVSVPISNGD